VTSGVDDYLKALERLADAASQHEAATGEIKAEVADQRNTIEQAHRTETAAIAAANDELHATLAIARDGLAQVELDSLLPRKVRPSSDGTTRNLPELRSTVSGLGQLCTALFEARDDRRRAELAAELAARKAARTPEPARSLVDEPNPFTARAILVALFGLAGTAFAAVVTESGTVATIGSLATVTVALILSRQRATVEPDRELSPPN